MHTEIVYADVGALGNPQPKIIGVKREFQKGVIRFQVCEAVFFCDIKIFSLSGSTTI